MSHSTRNTSRQAGRGKLDHLIRRLRKKPAADALKRRPDPAAPAPLSTGQERLWFLDRLEPGRATYNIPLRLKVRGPLEVGRLRRALLELTRRHEILRTRYAETADGPRQVVDAAAPPFLTVAELDGLPSVVHARRAVQDLAEREAERPFDLEHGPVLRAVVVRLAATEHQLVLVVHHVATDAASQRLLITELWKLYAALDEVDGVDGTAEALPQPSLHYADWAAWQRRRLPEVLEKKLAPWRESLAGVPVLDLPLDRPRPATRAGNGLATTRRLLGHQRFEALQELGQRHGATPFMMLVAAFEALLFRFSNQDDFAIGTPVAGRTRAEVENVVGFFVNTLVLRADVAGDPPFSVLLERVRQRFLDAHERQEVPFERLVEELQTGRGGSTTPLFQVMLSFAEDANSKLGARIGPADLEVEIEPLHTRTAKFDLWLELTADAAGLRAVLEYDVAIFDRTSAERLLDALAMLLEGASGAARLSALPILTPAQRQLAVAEFNDTAKPYALACLHHAFAAQAAQTPAAVALDYDGADGPAELSYGELAAAASRLARYLIRLGVRPEDRVGVMLERSLDLVVALYGVLGAGAAYVPLDPTYPEDRLAYMLEDSQRGVAAPVVLVQASLAGQLAELAAGASLEMRAVEVDGADRQAIAKQSDAPPRVEVTLDHAAYVIYTSGSTGRPKGVVNAHRGISNRLIWMQEAYALGADDRVLQKTPMSFDVSVWEFFWPLLVGARLVIARPEGHKDPAYLVQVIRRHGVTTLHFVPSMLQAFLEERSLEERGLGERGVGERGVGERGPESLASLQRVICSGEALPLDLVARFEERLGPTGAELHNLYGPTEAAVDVTWWPCAGWRAARRVPIGRPIANTRVHVVDRHGRPVPLGVAGELLLGGVQLARGYLGRPGLTAERFVPDGLGGPHPPTPSPRGRGGVGARLYRTGDLTRWLADGNVEYLGRIDFQVKLRGFRIELGEIEAALTDLDGLREAVVVMREKDGDPRLVAYAVGASDVDPEACRGALGERLPEYMVPSVIMMLEEMPLSPSGKVERRQLPDPEWASQKAVYVAPRTRLEAELAETWQELLGVERVGALDDFFALGGHSLLATRLVALLRERHGVEVELRRVFERPTLEALAATVAAAGAAAEPPLKRQAWRPGEPRPLSFAQRRLWFLERLDPGRATYNVPLALELHGPLDAARLERALARIVARHEVLQGRFVEVKGEPAQLVEAPPPYFMVVDLTGTDLAGAGRPGREEAAALLAREARRPFDLERGPLLRAVLVRLEDERHRLLLHLHHIVTDGWSQGLLLDELAALLEPGGAARRAALPVQYADFARWQKRRVEEVLDEQLAWWQKHLTGLPVLELPTDRPRPAARAGRGGQVRRRLLTAAGLGALEDLGRRSGATLFMLVLAAFEALLARLSLQRDFAVGTPVSGRERPEVAELIGFFVHTLVLRADLSPLPREASFEDFLARVRATVLDAFARPEVPFERLVEALHEDRRSATPPLCQVALTPLPEGLSKRRAGALEIVPAEISSGTAKFDLTLGFAATEEGLWAGFEYDLQLFDESTAERYLVYLQNLLEAAVAAPGRAVDALPLSTPAERHQALVEWNDTAAPFLPAVGEGPVQGRVAAWAARQPRALAVDDGETRLDYAELVDRARRLAGVLVARGVGPETRVGVFVDRSAALLVAVLGVLEAGGAYVPLDPAAPAERSAYQLDDAGTPAVVTVEGLRDRLAELVDPQRIVTVEETASAALPDAAAIDALPAVSLDHLAYVIYTSGSTGRPKGTELTHRGLLNLVAWHQRAYGVSAADRVTQIASPAFDAAVWEVWPYLTAGASIHVPPAAEAHAARPLLSYLERRKIDLCFMPTPLGEAVLEELESTPRPGLALRGLLVGGDRLHPVRGAPPVALFNHYGPTEVTVASTATRVRGQSRRAPSIGRPLANLRVYLVDPRLEPRPLGAHGELAVGGVGVGRGYLGRPGLTAEKFVPDPFAAGSRLYRTGDLARWGSDGSVEFLGRIDHQVKIRGFRVEIGEIEATLREHPAVGEAVVAAQARDGGGPARLVAWLAAAEDGVTENVTEEEVTAFLASRLPEYMVPRAFVLLEALPLLPSGKVNRRALPAPSWEGEGEYVAPRTPLEERLAELWAELLGVERVGIHDDFFALGGHSLLATRLSSRLAERFGVEIELRRIFDAPTLAELAPLVEAAGVEAAGVGAADGASTPPPLVPTPRPANGPWRFPLSFAQERLWFLDQLDPGQAGYNVQAAARLTGKLRYAAFAAALDEIVRRHEALRTTFALHQGSPVQVVSPPRTTLLARIDLRGLPGRRRRAEAERQVLADARQPFDLARGPLLRTALLRLGEQEHVLTVNMHHVVSDGWSLDVFLRELAALYGAALVGQPSPLPALPVQYADYAAWQRAWLTGAELLRQLDWWRERLASLPDLDLPFDRPRSGRLSLRGAVCTSRLPAALLERLESYARERGATLFMALLAAWNLLLARLSGQRDFAVGTPAAHRDRSEVEPLIGFFVNTLVLRADLANEDGKPPSYDQALDRVRRETLEAQERQDIPFQKLVEEWAPRRQLDVTPFFQVMLALQNLASQEALTLPGLEVEPWVRDAGVSKFDLGVQWSADAAGLEGRFAYKTDLFDRVSVERLARRFKALVAALTAAPQRPFTELALLGAAEAHQALVEWNDQPRFPAARLLHEEVLAQARRTPERPAFVLEGQAWTYGELDERSARLARTLRGRGVGPDVLVGVQLERSIDLMVALLAILRAGGAYVPLAPGDPPQRLAQIFEDSGVRLVLTSSSLLASLPGTSKAFTAETFTAETLCLDRPADLEPTGAVPESPVRARPENLAYVLYTSGSTGRPKGVMISHRAIAGRLAYMAAEELDADAVFIQKTTLTFDPSLAEIFAPLLVGGCSVAARPGAAREPGHLVELIKRHGVTHTSMARALLEILISSGALNSCTSLRQVLVGGEKVPEDLPGAFYAHLPETRLENRYGPTETTISVTRWICRPAPERSLPIGRPFAGAEIVVLDRWGKPAPIGVVGEIAIGGPVLARGYLGRPQRTAESFVPHPWRAGERLYRSGDLGRTRHDGALEFLGRIDTQVKIRGFRVELGEIEAALRQHAAVRDAAVIDLPDGATRRLVAFVAQEAAGEADGAVDGEELRSYLERRLPKYMVPQAVAFRDELPITAAGKIDRAALALEAPGSERRETAPVSPRDALEELLAERWAALFDGPPPGMEDDFFALGGTSISAALLSHRLQEDLGATVPVALIFEAPTIAGLARRLAERLPAAAALRDGEAVTVSDAVTASGEEAIAPRPAGQNVAPATAGQRWYWRLDRVAPGHPAYNIPVVLELEGALDAAALRAALARIAERHEVLRTSFVEQDGELLQRVETDAGRAFERAFARLDLDALESEPRDAAAERLTQSGVEWRFDLTRAPLWRAILLRLSPNRHRLLLVMHHAISDGWSVGVILRELAALYGAAVSGAAPSPEAVPRLPIQVADWALFEARQDHGAWLEAALQSLAGAPRRLDLPISGERPARRSLRGDAVRLDLGAALSRDLAALARERRSTLFTVLLTGFEILLHELTGSVDLVIGTQAAQRDRRETRDLVGYFVNLLPLRARLDGDPTLDELIERTKRETSVALARQELRIADLVAASGEPWDDERMPLFQVLFTLQSATRAGMGATAGKPSSGLELPGLATRVLERRPRTSRFDLSLAVVERESAGEREPIMAEMEFATDLLCRATVEGWLERWRSLLERLVERPAARLSEIVARHNPAVRR